MKFFKLDDTDVLVELHGRRPIFRLKEFNFTDELNHQLDMFQTLLYANKFKINDFEIEFYLSDDIIKIQSVFSERYNLYMCSDTLAIGKTMVSIYDDGSGRMTIYVGDKSDPKWWKNFVRGKNFHAKMDGRPRTYLHYTFNVYDYQFEIEGNDSREYPPLHTDRRKYDPILVMLKLEMSLRKIIHKIGNQSDIHDLINIPLAMDIFREPDPELLTNEHFRNTIFVAYVDKNRNEKPIPGWRVLSLSDSLDHPLENEMHEGFIYMDVFDSREEIPYDMKNVQSWMLAGCLGKSFDRFMVIPTTYKKFFVMDYAAENPAMTMVRINEYQGGFIKPIVVCNRILADKELKKL